MKGAAQFFLDTLVQEPTLGYLVTNPSNSPELNHHSGVSVCAGPTMDNQILRDLFNGVRAGRPGARRRRRLPDPGPGHPRPAAADEGRLARQHHGVAVRLGRDRDGPTGTSPTCTGCTPATRSPSAARPPSTPPPAAPSNCAATTAPAGRSPGRSTTGRGWRRAPARTTSSACWSRPPGSRRTCSTCTRRSRSTATSAPPPASPRCCCRATTASCTCCRPCRRPGRAGRCRGCAGAAATPWARRGAAGRPTRSTIRFDRDGTVKVRGRFLTGTFTVTDTTSGAHRHRHQARDRRHPAAAAGRAHLPHRRTGAAAARRATCGSPTSPPAWCSTAAATSPPARTSSSGTGTAAPTCSGSWSTWAAAGTASSTAPTAWSWTAGATPPTARVCRQAAWNGGNNQQWRLNDIGNGRYQIINRGTGTALDGMGNTTAGSTVPCGHPTPAPTTTGPSPLSKKDSLRLHKEDRVKRAWLASVVAALLTVALGQWSRCGSRRRRRRWRTAWPVRRRWAGTTGTRSAATSTRR